MRADPERDRARSLSKERRYESRVRCAIDRRGGQKNSMFSAHAEIGIEILPQPLRHIGDLRTNGGAMARVAEIAAKDIHLPLWMRRAPVSSASREDLPTPSGTDQPHHPAFRDRERHVIKRNGLAVTQRNSANSADPRRQISLRRTGQRSRPNGLPVNAHEGPARQSGAHERGT